MIDFWKDEPEIEKGLELVLSILEKTAGEASPYINSYLIDMVQSHGKMLRPAFVLLGALTCNRPIDHEVCEIAAVLEMIHIASLIHDDIIDSASLRRGKPTLFKQLGARKAVLAGDYMLTRAISLIHTTESQGLSPQHISRAFTRLCTSEISQDSEEWDFSISKTHYLRRIAGKTATLFALSLYAGAHLADADELKKIRLHRIGYAIGMAFQIKDDILDYIGTKSSMGKQTGKDLASGIITLPFILARESRMGTELVQLTGQKTSFSRTTAQKIITKVIDLGGVSEADALAERYLRRAQRDFLLLSSKNTQDIFDRMIEKLTLRVT